MLLILFTLFFSSFFTHLEGTTDLRGNVPGLCYICTKAVLVAESFAKMDISIETKLKYFRKLCDIGMPSEVCGGILNILAPEVDKVLSTSDVPAERLCYEFRYCPKPTSLNTTFNFPFSTLSSFSYEYNNTSPFHETLKWQPLLSKGIGTILHISDIHIDLNYVPGTSIDCNKPSCCHEEDGPGTAGKWGAPPKCDLTIHAFERALEQLKSNPETSHPDILFITGDLPGHDVWLQSRESIARHITVIYQLIKKYYSDTLVIPVQGNHDTFPIGQVDLYGKDQWIFDLFASLWKPWLPKQVLSEVKNFGYYTLKIREKLRLIILNTQLADKVNFYRYIHLESDPHYQLSWLDQQLSAAEYNNEKVMIALHIPTGNNFMSYNYGNSLYDIITQHSPIVVAIFGGHTHLDDFQILFTDDIPSIVLHIAPGLTSYRGFPAVKLYNYNRESYQLNDWKTFVFDVDSENFQMSEYMTASSSYKLKDLSALSMDGFITRMGINQKLLQNYYTHRTRGYNKDKCEGICRDSLLCRLKCATNDCYDDCYGSNDEFDENLNF